MSFFLSESVNFLWRNNCFPNATPTLRDVWKLQRYRCTPPPLEGAKSITSGLGEEEEEEEVDEEE
jgi:hypothetical protein